MYLIRMGKATARDVQEMVKVLEHERHWQFVNKVIWRECEELGLVNDETLAMLAEKTKKFEPTKTSLTTPERRTKRIRSV